MQAYDIIIHVNYNMAYAQTHLEYAIIFKFTQKKSQLILTKLRKMLHSRQQLATTTRRNLLYTMPNSNWHVFGYTECRRDRSRVHTAQFVCSERDKLSQNIKTFGNCFTFILYQNALGRAHLLKQTNNCGYDQKQILLSMYISPMVDRCTLWFNLKKLQAYFIKLIISFQ